MVVGGPQSDEAREPTLLFDPEHIGNGQWRGRKKPKKGAVSVNELDTGKVKQTRLITALEYPSIVNALENEPVALVIAPSLVRGFKYDNAKPVDQLSQTEIAQEIRTLAWNISSAEGRTTPDFESLRKMRSRLGAIKEHLNFRSQMQLSLKNWNPGDDLGKAFGKKPEMAAPGRQPAKNASTGLNPKTGKQTYTYAAAKMGKKPTAPKKQGSDDKPDRHTAAAVANRLGVPIKELEDLAGQTTAAGFSAHLRTHKLKELMHHQVHANDIANIHRELSSKRKP
jgi:hypothetical protein